VNYKLFQVINQNAGYHPILDVLMVFVTKDALIVYALVLLLMWFFGNEKFKYTVILATITGALGLFLNFILGHVYYEPRPFVTHHVHLLINHVKDGSFPSDHTTGSFSLALAVLWRRHLKIGLGMLFFATLTGFSRIYVGHHYPFDILGSIIVALLISSLVYTLSSFFKPIGIIIITIYNRIPLTSKTKKSISK
jgi:undecaprenyl-diphosphatase